MSPGNSSDADQPTPASEPEAQSGIRRPRGDHVQEATDWFATDQSDTRQALDSPEGTISPGQLLAWARFGTQLDDLMAPGSADHAHRADALVQAQAQWLIRRMPGDHHRPCLDSAQQAGRAWGILIATDTAIEPDNAVLAAVAKRTGISVRAAHEIREQARITAAAYNRAELLMPYDNATVETLIRDWNLLIACGPELPEAVAHAHDVQDLLTPRLTGHEHDWIEAPEARHTAQLLTSLIHAQPLLAAAASLIPTAHQHDTAAAQSRLADAHPNLISAATAAAQVWAVTEWANGTPAKRDRIRAVEAAVPAMRTILSLNRTLAALGADAAPCMISAAELTQLTQTFDDLSAMLKALAEVPQQHRPAPPSRSQPQNHHPHTAGGHDPESGPPARSQGL